MDPNLAVKVTCNVEGIKAIKELVPQGVRTNCTLKISPSVSLKPCSNDMNSSGLFKNIVSFNKNSDLH
jgi:hypothetical protein